MSIKSICLYGPPLIIFIVLCISYYIYVMGFCVELVADPKEFYPYLLFYNIFFLLLSWTFLATVFTPPETVPERYKLTEDEVGRWTRLNPQDRQIFLQSMINKKCLVIETLHKGYIRYCIKCEHIKPDRAHHCSTCEICVLKMDHHCPWVNNCIGFSNYKCFCLLMMYCVIYCGFILSTMVKYLFFSSEFKQQNISVVVGLIMAVVFGMVGTIFFSYNMDLLAENETVLERMREPEFIQPNVTYNLGCRRNFVEEWGRAIRLNLDGYRSSNNKKHKRKMEYGFLLNRKYTRSVTDVNEAVEAGQHVDWGDIFKEKH